MVFDFAEPNGTITLYYPERASYALTSLWYRVDKETGIAVAAFNYQKNLHALTRNQMLETFAVLEHAKLDEDVKVLIWTATGPKAFCSGAALRGEAEETFPPEAAKAYAARKLGPGPDFVLANQTRAFWDFPKPIIMAINGLAVGGGANLALMNFGDLVVASTAAKFKWPFASLNLSPELTSSYMMPFLVGMPRAKEMMLLGEWFSAEQAQALGLVNRVVPPDQLMPTALELAGKLANHVPTTNSNIKRVMNDRLRRILDNLLETEDEYIQSTIKLTGVPSKLQAHSRL